MFYFFARNALSDRNYSKKNLENTVCSQRTHLLAFIFLHSVVSNLYYEASNFGALALAPESVISRRSSADFLARIFCSPVSLSFISLTCSKSYSLSCYIPARVKLIYHHQGRHISVMLTHAYRQDTLAMCGWNANAFKATHENLAVLDPMVVFHVENSG